MYSQGYSLPLLAVVLGQPSKYLNIKLIYFRKLLFLLGQISILKFSLHFTSTQVVGMKGGRVVTMPVENVEKMAPSTSLVGIC